MTWGNFGENHGRLIEGTYPVVGVEREQQNFDVDGKNSLEAGGMQVQSLDRIACTSSREM